MSIGNVLYVCLISCVLGLVLGLFVGVAEGKNTGAEMHYTNKVTCETLLDKTVRCIPTSQVKEK